MLREFNAFWDEPNYITLHLPQRFFSQELSFTIESHTHVLTPQIETNYQVDDIYIYRLYVSELHFETFYTVFDHERNATPLQLRNIVRSTAFDDHFFYGKNDLGATYTPTKTTFKLWAPLSETVLLVLNHNNTTQSFPMHYIGKGVWHIDCIGDYDTANYFYVTKVNGKWIESHDPYALSSQPNSKNSVVINKEKLLQVSPVKNAAIPIVYEMSVRDFTSQAKLGFKHPRTFKGLCESVLLQEHSIGFDYLKRLGITHVQLMPVYDFGSVDEIHPLLMYNWGYDPVQYNVPDGSYSTNAFDPYSRILELQYAIDFYHRHDIQVIMDVVYNHVYHIQTFSIEKLVPGYAYRVDTLNQPTNGTFCGNDIASERKMMRQYIKQSLLQWTTLYGFDGFRFDLMGILDIETMQDITTTLQTINENILLYGEGWEMNTGLPTYQLSHQNNAHFLPNIGFFNDLYRETMKNIIVSPTHISQQNLYQVIEEILSGTTGIALPHGKYLSYKQSLNYVECHDNATFFDYLSQQLPNASLVDIQNACRFALKLILISQGIPFIHSGQEFYRTKHGVENSYNSPDDINQLDWNRAISYFDEIQEIAQFIQFRKNYAHLFQLSSNELSEAISFYWLNDTVLCYSLKHLDTHISFIINFSFSTYTYAKEKPFTLHAVSKNSEETITSIDVPGQSIIVIKHA